MREQGNAANNRKQLVIEYLYLDLQTCDRCIGTDTVLERTLDLLRPKLADAGYEVIYRKKEMSTAELACRYRFLSSPTIRLNGYDIFGAIKENNCGCCGKIAGTDIDCRVFEWAGKCYEVPPKKVMAEALLRAIGKTAPPDEGTYVLPDNLKRFYDGKSRPKAHRRHRYGHR